MCYHRLYIFTTCGHSCYATYPILPCDAVRNAPRDPTKSSSEITKPLPVARPSQPPSSPIFSDEPLNKGKGKEKAQTDVTSCPGPQSHPLQSLRLHRLCAVCTRRRDALLCEVESGHVVRFEDWRWKVKYQSQLRVELTDWNGASVGEVLGSWVGGWGGDWSAERSGGKGPGGWLAALRDVAASPVPAPAKGDSKDGSRVGFRGGIGSS
ncbi:uncharacterized protein BDZ99DRAFT_572444 [Mytilinidion resinicola]|uniref:Uncharacterized protein n=1 Tax=Mytilinidion resinicola TaxID=574789 RepID=A0A6A6YJ65_9PEZI|nr:uncharacterized protein BDZ99DRAFT_572444 [Mytilinidion resinicola]KAF2808609.1 hypothetical protein BDZ99DRAFT_572444 [Mytilinidion resinicola]